MWKKSFLLTRRRELSFGLCYTHWTVGKLHGPELQLHVT